MYDDSRTSLAEYGVTASYRPDFEMNPDRKYPHRVDLARVKAERLEIHADISLDERLRESLLQCCFDEEDRQAGIAAFGTAYSKNKVRHAVSARVTGLLEPDEPQHLRIDYEVETMAKPAKGLQSLSKLFAILGPMSDKLTFLCFASFTYPWTTHSSLLTLPMKIEESEGLPFDEIRGLRLTRVRDDKMVYTAIVDRPTNEEIAHLISFTYSGRLTPQVPGEILTRATEISLRFVSELPEERTE